jgi:uncharacterized protein YndB with AHSA1/START domain
MLFDLVSEWRLDAPPAEVWDALVDVAAWPGWWPSVRSVVRIRNGDADGLGACHRIVWTTALPYRIAFDTETVAVAPMRRIEAKASGALEGRGIWLLEPSGAGCVVRYRWQVRPIKPWMRLAAGLLRPVFAWNHGKVMERGQRGLADFLAGRSAAEARTEHAA